MVKSGRNVIAKSNMDSFECFSYWNITCKWRLKNDWKILKSNFHHQPIFQIFGKPNAAMEISLWAKFWILRGFHQQNLLSPYLKYRGRKNVWWWLGKSEANWRSWYGQSSNKMGYHSPANNVRFFMIFLTWSTQVTYLYIHTYIHTYICIVYIYIYIYI